MLIDIEVFIYNISSGRHSYFQGIYTKVHVSVMINLSPLKQNGS